MTAQTRNPSVSRYTFSLQSDQSKDLPSEDFIVTHFLCHACSCSRGDKAFLINHFEAGQPGSMYKSTLIKDRNGAITVQDTEVRVVLAW